MCELIEKHEPVHDCDCRECALVERDRLRIALKQSNNQTEHFERECCGTFPGTPHRATCAKYRGKFKVTPNTGTKGRAVYGESSEQRERL